MPQDERMLRTPDAAQPDVTVAQDRRCDPTEMRWEF
jgi:hypothetical protein